MESGEASPIVILENVALGRLSFLIAISQFLVFCFLFFVSGFGFIVRLLLCHSLVLPVRYAAIPIQQGMLNAKEPQTINYKPQTIQISDPGPNLSTHAPIR